MQVKKSENASLEKDKLVYVLIGLVFTLSLVFVALEWTEKEVKVHTVVEETVWNDEELDIQQTSQETPPPPPPPAAQEVEVLNVVEDNVETESIEVNTEDDKEVEVIIAAPVELPVEEEEEEVVFKVVEQQAEFPGGPQAMFKYLSEHIKYPVICQENGIQGKVICQFTVNKDGSIVDIQVLRSSGHDALDKEAMRVIQSMPKWAPGKQRGKPVRSRFTLPVTFKLQ
jgi:protein TonB